jgi:hypothetical protein
LRLDKAHRSYLWLLIRVPRIAEASTTSAFPVGDRMENLLKVHSQAHLERNLSTQPGVIKTTAAPGIVTLDSGLGLLFHLGLAEAHARAAAVLRDKRYASRF